MRQLLVFFACIAIGGFAGFLVGIEQSQHFCDFNIECLHPIFGYPKSFAIFCGTLIGAFSGALAGIALTENYHG